MSEMFSPERVTAVCRDDGLEPGQAMDLKNDYDLYLASDRQKAWESILRDKTMFVVGSPPCAYFSRLQELDKHMYKDNAVWMAKFHEHVDQAKRYVRFCIKVYNHQLENHRYLSHEHPLLATSWFMPEMIKLEGDSEVLKVRIDMCQFGMVSRTAGIGSALGPVLKPTGCF